MGVEVYALNATLTGMPSDAALFHDTTALQGASVVILADGTSAWSASRVRDTLTGAGWRVTSVQESEARTTPREDTDTSYPTAFGTWTATTAAG